MSKQTGLGIAFILVGVAFVNSWFLGILAPDGEIQGLPYNLNIVLCQLLFYVVGIGLIGWKQSRQRLLVLTASALAVVSLYNVFHLDIESAEEREPVAGLQSEQVVLQRVIQLSGDGTAELSMETRPLLYSPGTPVQSRKLLVPDDGVLDTATGIDSRMSLIFDGTAYFRISVASPGEPSKAIYDRRVDLGASDPKAFEWTGVSLDLSEFAGQEIELDFEKGLRQQDSFVSEAYDLTPEDLMFWQEPKLRPKQLSDRPNVILISLDTLRIDHLHHMGYRRETSSNLDSLAKQGTFFTQCISQAPWTTPSHFSIFTSMYPSSHKGNRPIQVTTRFLSSRARTMAEILDDSGYVTAAFTGSGSISAQFGFYRGFDSYNETSRPETGSDIDGILAKSIPWLQNHADRSFFLFLHTYEPHEPYNDDFFVTKEAIEETDSIAYSTAKYDGDIRRADWFLGEIVGALRGLGLLEKTILVVTSDHGEDLDRRAAPGAPSPAHGHTLYDELLRVPLVFFGPGIPAGNRIEFQVRSIDILPTVLDLVGLGTRDDFEGASLRGMLEGKDREPRPAYSEATTYGTERESLRADGYKYIHRISYGQLADPMSWGLPLTPRHELYDLENDSEERTNTSDDNPLKVQEFQDLMRTINPRRTGEGQDPGSSPDSIDLTQDSELMDELRSLGYIQ